MTGPEAWGLSLVGVIALYAGAEALIRGAASLALRFGLSPLVIGMTVVAFGTSAAELGVSLDAAWRGRGDIALGNVVGSNICNIGLILGISALIRPLGVDRRLLRLDIPILIVAQGILVWLVWDGALSRTEGLLLLVALVGHTVFTVRQGSRDATPAPELPGIAARGTGYSLGLTAVGLAAVLFGSDAFVRGGSEIARTLGVSEAAIALTLIALGTSLPELATSAVAAVRGENDLAIGNVIGSNLFNALAVAGASATLRPLEGNLRPVDLGVMFFFAIVMAPLLRTGFTLVRWEGALLLVGYVGYVVLCLR